MNRIKRIINILTLSISDDNRRQCNKNVAVSAVVCLAAGIMLIMNILKHSTLWYLYTWLSL